MWELLGSLVSGGALGLFGNAINLIGDFAKAKMQFAHDREMRKLDIHAMTREAELGIQRDTVLMEGKIEEADIDARAVMVETAYKYDKRTYSDNIIEKVLEKFEPKGFGWIGWVLGVWPMVMLMAIVDFMRGVTRPTMIWYSAIATSAFCYMIWTKTEGFATIDDDTVAKMSFYIVCYIFHLTGMAWAFLFCERGRVKPPQMPQPALAGGGTLPTKDGPPTPAKARRVMDDQIDTP